MTARVSRRCSHLDCTEDVCRLDPSHKWTRDVEPVLCDTCCAPATWRHPLGGLRCDDCPRPEAA